MRNCLSLVGISLITYLSCTSCDTKAQPNTPVQSQPATAINTDTTPTTASIDTTLTITREVDTLPPLKAEEWAELTELDSTIRLDIRYATDNNFVGQVLYNCPRCYLRTAPAQAVVAAHKELQKEGLGLKMYDCYRPRAVQYRLWEIFPQPGYVANPDKGSIHNRGGAVDLTIVDSLGNELPMGTDFDFFGPDAHHPYTDLPEEVLANRLKLKALMNKHGFSSIRKEWWHYNYRGNRYELSDQEWPCTH